MIDHSWGKRSGAFLGFGPGGELGSVFAGTTFVAWTGSASAGLTVLAQYSAGGAVWYLLTAIWLSWTAR